MASQFTSQPWMQGNSESESLNLSGLPPEEAITLQKLSRKQQLANYLLQKALTGQQGGMAGKFYVAPSWTQGVAQLAEAGLGTYMNKNIDEERSLMAQEIEKRRNADVTRLIEETQGKNVPERTLPQGTPETPSNLEDIIADTKPAMGTPQVRPMTTPSLAPSYGEDAASPGKYYDDLPPSPELLAAIQQRMQPPPMPYQPGDPGVPATQGPVNEAQFQKPDPSMAREAVIRAMGGSDPRVANVAKFMEQQKASEEEKAMQRTFQAEQKDLDRQNQIDKAEIQLSQTLLVAGMTGMKQEDIAKLRVDGEEKIAKIREAGSDRRDNVQAVVGVDPTSSTGYAYFDARNKQKLFDAPKPPSEVAAGKSATKGDLPANALKMQQEALDAIGLASGLNADIAETRRQISAKELDLSAAKNYINQAKNWVGWSTPEGQKFADFKALLEKQRNDSLRLNKGVQTEGDAVRAWNELISNLNDPAVVDKRLETISKLNERAVGLQKNNVETIRKNYHADPFDFSGYTTMSPSQTPGAPAPVQAPPASGVGVRKFNPATGKIE